MREIGKTLAVELKKEKRTGVILLMPAVGILGAAYAAQRNAFASSVGAYGCAAYAVVWHDYDIKYVRDYRRRLYYLSYRI